MSADHDSSSPGPGFPNDEDADLLLRIKAGQEEALQQLYRRYAPLVFHLACRALDRAAAEEIVQDTFFAVWRRATDFDPARGSFRTWLLSIARHRMLDELRTRARRPQASSEAWLDQAFLSAEEPLPDEALWHQYQREAVSHALAELPEPQRTALRLAFFADLTHEEVARTLRVPLGTAKTRIRSGLRLLERHLGGLVALLVVAFTGSWLYVRQTKADRLSRRAVHLLADSQTKTLRLVPPASGTSPETGLHATFRGARGADLAVLTLAHFPDPPAAHRYVLWIRTGQGWMSANLQPPDRDGHALQILEVPWRRDTWPLELRITQERQSAQAPSGMTMAAWVESPRPAQPALP